MSAWSAHQTSVTFTVFSPKNKRRGSFPLRKQSRQNDYWDESKLGNMNILYNINIAIASMFSFVFLIQRLSRLLSAHSPSMILHVPQVTDLMPDFLYISGVN